MLTRYVCGIFRTTRNDNQITDLLQLSRKEYESRILCMNALRHRNAWKRMQKIHKNSPATHAKIEGVLHVKKVRNAILFYKSVRKGRIEAFNLYMEKLAHRNVLSGGAR